MANLKTGVRRGGDFLWSVAILEASFEEAMRVIGSAGYSHFADQVKELARHAIPSQCESVDVKALEDFFEIRDHGGPLGNVNVRVFFGLDRARRTIVTLGCAKKQNNGPTPLGEKLRMRTRWVRYKRGEYGFI